MSQPVTRLRVVHKSDVSLTIVAGLNDATVQDGAAGTTTDPGQDLLLGFPTNSTVYEVLLIVRKPDLVTWNLTKAWVNNVANLSAAGVTVQRFEVDGRSYLRATGFTGAGVLFGDPNASGQYSQGLSPVAIPVTDSILLDLSLTTAPAPAGVGSIEVQIHVLEAFVPLSFQFPFNRAPKTLLEQILGR